MFGQILKYSVYSNPVLSYLINNKCFMGVFGIFRIFIHTFEFQNQR